jgi:hypothetical protein
LYNDGLSKVEILTTLNTEILSFAINFKQDTLKNYKVHNSLAMRKYTLAAGISSVHEIQSKE